MEFLAEYRPILATFVGIVGLFVLILRVRMDAFAALLLVAICSALAAGLAPEATFKTVQAGMGGTLGFIAPVIGLGALFGAILEAGGGVQALARGVGRAGTPRLQRWAMGALGVIAATPVFFDVALIILLPFIMGLAGKAGRKPLVFGLPLCVGLAAGHAFIPPTPGPIAIAELIGADLGWVILFGLITSVISVAVAGPIWAGWLERSGRMPEGHPVLGSATIESDRKIGFGLAALLILLPLILILAGTLAKLGLAEGSAIRYILSVIGHPFSALLIASGLSWSILGTDAESRAHMKNVVSRALAPTAVVILVTGAGGAFKQVLVDTGAGAQMAQGVLSLGLTPVLAGFVLALLVRVAQGSATVAMITAGGLAAPIVTAADLSAPQLGIVTIAIAAGATGFSHVNDSGFWLVSRLFGITERETLRSWTLATGWIALSGLAVCCCLYPFV